MLQLFYIQKEYFLIFLAGTTIHKLRTRDASIPWVISKKGSPRDDRITYSDMLYTSRISKSLSQPLLNCSFIFSFSFVRLYFGSHVDVETLKAQRAAQPSTEKFHFLAVIATEPDTRKVAHFACSLHSDWLIFNQQQWVPQPIGISMFQQQQHSRKDRCNVLWRAMMSKNKISQSTLQLLKYLCRCSRQI